MIGLELKKVCRLKFNFFLFYKSKNIKFWESNFKNIWKNKMNEKK